MAPHFFNIWIVFSMKSASIPLEPFD